MSQCEGWAKSAFITYPLHKGEVCVGPGGDSAPDECLARACSHNSQGETTDGGGA